MTPIVKDGCLYGFDGQDQRLASLVCLDIAAGKELWRDELGGKFQRGSLLAEAGRGGVADGDGRRRSSQPRTLFAWSITRSPTSRPDENRS